MCSIKKVNLRREKMNSPYKIRLANFIKSLYGHHLWLWIWGILFIHFLELNTPKNKFNLPIYSYCYFVNQPTSQFPKNAYHSESIPYDYEEKEEKKQEESQKFNDKTPLCNLYLFQQNFCVDLFFNILFVLQENCILQQSVSLVVLYHSWKFFI
jgi:hypothetical protein